MDCSRALSGLSETQSPSHSPAPSETPLSRRKRQSDTASALSCTRMAMVFGRNAHGDGLASTPRSSSDQGRNPFSCNDFAAWQSQLHDDVTDDSVRTLLRISLTPFRLSFRPKSNHTPHQTHSHAHSPTPSSTSANPSRPAPASSTPPRASHNTLQ